MQTDLPGTFFTAPPGFGWPIITYFFIGGIAAGALLLAGLLRLFGTAADRPYIRIASIVALVGAFISVIVLILDLSAPLRFWHMVIQNHTGRLMFKWWSPMSDGIWILTLFSFFALVAVLESLALEDRPRLRRLRFLSRAPFHAIGAIGGIVFGLALAGYTGVLLAVTNRPLWADSSWLGIVFLFSAVSTAIATLLLLSHWRRMDSAITNDWLARFDNVTLVLELLAIVFFLISLGGAVRALLNAWGVVLVLGVIVVGIILPLVIQRRPSHSVVLPAVLVLAGGLMLRMVVMLSSEQIHVSGVQVFR
ncbi:MAG TPA: NrfD/PsrC family molybdoenzyme membrane anchor subunit [Gemmatimonadaceae bacterium]|nr:NrfD/PsrC family molybdoenzyme membrane anchor subunit [Gemmatimonadaceae bacterium]